MFRGRNRVWPFSSGEETFGHDDLMLQGMGMGGSGELDGGPSKDISTGT